VEGCADRRPHAHRGGCGPVIVGAMWSRRGACKTVENRSPGKNSSQRLFLNYHSHGKSEERHLADLKEEARRHGAAGRVRPCVKARLRGSHRGASAPKKILHAGRIRGRGNSGESPGATKTNSGNCTEAKHLFMGRTARATKKKSRIQS